MTIRTLIRRWTGQRKADAPAKGADAPTSDAAIVRDSAGAAARDAGRSRDEEAARLADKQRAAVFATASW
jgi:hypothetical protein